VVKYNSASSPYTNDAYKAPIVLTLKGNEALTVTHDSSLLSADFSREGFDLLITLENGECFLILDYFISSKLVPLMTGNGAFLIPEMVWALSGSGSPGQYADTGNSWGAQPVGKVDSSLGEVTATRVDGITVSLQKGSGIYQGDVLETGKDGALSIVFIDETEFSLGTDARMIIDELIFDPSSLEGSSSFSVIEGVFVFVSGEIAANSADSMVVKTPVATLGIRGTKVAGRAAAEGNLNTITLMPEEGEVTGSILVSNASGTVALSSAFQTATVTSVFDKPAHSFTLNSTQADSLFGGVDRLLATERAGIRADDRKETTEESRKQSDIQGNEQLAVTEEETSPGKVSGDATGEPEAEELGEVIIGDELALEGDISDLQEGSLTIDNAGKKVLPEDISDFETLADENLIEASVVSENAAFNEFEAALDAGADFGEAIEKAIVAQADLFDSLVEGGVDAYFSSIDDFKEFSQDGIPDIAQVTNEFQDFNLRDIEAFQDQENLAEFAEALGELGVLDPVEFQLEEYTEESMDPELMSNFDGGEESVDGEFGEESFGDLAGDFEGGFEFGSGPGDPLLEAFLADPVGFDPTQVLQIGDFAFFDPLFDPLSHIQGIIDDLLGIVHQQEPEDFDERELGLEGVLSLSELATANVIRGTSGDDELTGTTGVDVIGGFAGTDTINALDGNDAMMGGEGNDVIRGGNGNDAIAGDGASNDFDGDAASIIVNLEEGSGDGADTIFGGDGNDDIVALGGDDSVDGDAGNDFINGGSGADTLNGGTGDDDIQGGSGDDLIDGGADDDYIEGGSGEDSIDGGSGNDEIEGFEGDDTILGGSGDDTINGNDGDDTIEGGDGADELAGNDGDDTILGNAGDDIIVGDGGDDTIIGGAGEDVVASGGGSDIYKFTALSDGGAVSTNSEKGSVSGDTMGDFDQGSDKFNFVSSAFGNLSTGSLPSANLSNLLSAAYDGTNSGKSSGAVFVFDNTNTLYFDPDTTSAGYTVIATTQSSITSINTSDIDIVSA